MSPLSRGRVPPTGRQARMRAPVHRVDPWANQSAVPAKNDTGIPKTPSDGNPNLPSLQSAKDDTETQDWNEYWDADNKPKHVPEGIEGDNKVQSQENERDSGKPELMPGLDDSTKATVSRIDDPPSPADVPDDMRYDPGGEGTPGIMPPIPAPVPGDENTEKAHGAPRSPEDYDGMDYLLPLGSD